MASVSSRIPRSPRIAARRKSALDRHLDTDLFRALADPTRAKLFTCLVKCGRPCSVGEVSECCAVDFSVVARHLSRLARSGLLGVEKKGRTVWYTARSRVLADRLRALAGTIDEWCVTGSGCCDPNSACCAPTRAKRNRRS